MINTSADTPMIKMMMSDRTPPTTKTKLISAAGQWVLNTSYITSLLNTLSGGWVNISDYICVDSVTESTMLGRVKIAKHLSLDQVHILVFAPILHMHNTNPYT